MGNSELDEEEAETWSLFLTEHGPQKKRQGMKVEDRPGACNVFIEFPKQEFSLIGLFLIYGFDFNEKKILFNVVVGL